MKLTEKQLAGLNLIGDGEFWRRSNVTDEGKRYLYWQTADALIDMGYAETAPFPLLLAVRITVAGRARLATEHGITS